MRRTVTSSTVRAGCSRRGHRFQRLAPKLYEGAWHQQQRGARHVHGVNHAAHEHLVIAHGQDVVDVATHLDERSTSARGCHRERRQSYSLRRGCCARRARGCSRRGRRHMSDSCRWSAGGHVRCHRVAVVRQGGCAARWRAVQGRLSGQILRGFPWPWRFAKGPPLFAHHVARAR